MLEYSKHICSPLVSLYSRIVKRPLFSGIYSPVDAPDTLGKMLGAEKFQELREARGLQHDGLMLPAKIADTYFHIAQQHRSAWTHELDLRAFSDLAWWNHQNPVSL